MKGNENGFTLVEMLLSISVMMVLIGLSTPLYIAFQNRSDLAATTQRIAETIRRAEVYARASTGDSAWSVEFTSTAVTIFKGTSYSSRDTSFDESVTIPSSITLSGLTELQFAKSSGTPNVTGTLTVTSNANASRSVVINAKGMVQD